MESIPPRALPAITPPQTDLERIQRKWQMASINHFILTFQSILPLKEIAPETYEDISADLLERGIAEPDLDTEACICLRDVIMTLLDSLKVTSRKSVKETWFQSLRMYVTSKKAEFRDLFDGDDNVMDAFENGMEFLVSVGWNVRLGLLQSLCDICAEESSTIRDAIKEAEGMQMVPGVGRSGIEERGYRLLPLGRCSQRRLHYMVGKTRIYSGYKRKGSGALIVECSNAQMMTQLAEALESSPHDRDKKIAKVIHEKYLGPLMEIEERAKKRKEKKRLAEIQKEESRRRNARRPRRAKASYF